jgi:hypothetical protein
MKRGILWAAESRQIAVEKGFLADKWKNDKGMY